MEKEAIEFLCGVIFTAVIPVAAIRQLRKGVIFSEQVDIQKRIICGITVISSLILLLFNQNSEMIMGTVIGNALFQILGMCGVGKLNSIDEQQKRELFLLSLSNIFRRWKKEKNGVWQDNLLQREYSCSSQYLAFCTILLLFLSADYLLRGESADNILNQIDGGLLIFLFCTYIYLVYGKRTISKSKIAQMGDIGQDGSKVLDKSRSSYIGKIYIHIFVYLLLGIVIIFGNYLLFESLSKFGMDLKISQYGIGLTLMTWCVNLSGILFIGLEEKVQFEKSGTQISQTRIYGQENRIRMEKIIENVIFLITFLLGGIVLIRPITVTIHMISDLIFFGIISLLLQILHRIDNRIAGCSMVTIYIGFVVYVGMR